MTDQCYERPRNLLAAATNSLVVGTRRYSCLGRELAADGGREFGLCQDSLARREGTGGTVSF